MKFIARKGAIDVPLELIEAQENNELVFFCGAGISYPAGLPDFKGLVNKVYKEIPAEKDALEEQAIKSGFYDRALGLLEERLETGNTTGVNVVRRAIISLLNLDSSADVGTHKALLQLSQTSDNNYRLVTTNVDHAFLLAHNDGKKLFDAAPKLPVPKPNKWSTVVHLHGLIDEDQDPDGEHLVFTSGDFGSAYLTERWASKFVTELFLNFTVVFVGYSINDPVIRYMTDAIAAERRYGKSHFKVPYVIAESPPSKKASTTKDWKAKGVVPVLYSKGGKNHPNLHNSIKAWAAHSRDGFNSKERIIRSKARIAPLPPYDQDESVKQVLDTLKERTNINHKDITGYPAKVFSEINDPPAPIQWLPVLHEEGLLSISEINECTPLVNTHNGFLLWPNKISLNLWRWLLLHLSDNTFISWLIDQGVCLHPYFKDMVRQKLESKNPPQGSYLLFWKIIISKDLLCNSDSMIRPYEAVKALINNSSDELVVSAFSKTLEPLYKVSKAHYWEKNDDGSNAPFSLDVVIGLEGSAFSSLIKSKTYPQDHTNLMNRSTQSLFKMMSFFSYIGKASDKSDRSHWDIVSIKPHEQNNSRKSLSRLAVLNRDFWSELYEQNKAEAKLTLAIWRGYQFPIFRRLVLHAYTSKDVVSDEAALAYLLEDDGFWLWSIETRRETFRFLHKVWPKITKEQAGVLLKVIVEGPPSDKHQTSLSEEEKQDDYDRKCWLILAKLESFGRSLFGESLVLFESLSIKHPQWVLQEDDRDEFTHWHTSSIGNEMDITQGALFELSMPERVKKLTEENRRYKEGRLDVFRIAGKDLSSDVIATLEYMFKQTNWDHKVWRAGLTGLAESEGSTWEFSPIVASLPKEIYKKESWAIAWWSSKAAEHIKIGSKKELELWKITENLIHNTIEEELALEADSEIINLAINNPIGIVLEGVFDYLSRCKIEAGNGLPKPQPFNLIQNILEGSGSSLVLGKVIIFSRLMYFYSVDQGWTREKLIPLLDFDVSEEAAYYWQGYLRSPRVSIDLATDIKVVLLKALEQQKLTGRNSQALIDLFTFSCLQYSDLFSAEERKKAFQNMGVNGLASVVMTMRRFISGESAQRNDFWTHRIKPLFKKEWPKGGEYLSPEISEEVALLALQLSDSFPDIVKTCLPIICPINNMYSVLSKFCESEVVSKHPNDSFLLFSQLFNEDDSFNRDLVSDVMRKLKKAEPALAEQTDFKRIENLLISSQ